MANGSGTSFNNPYDTQNGGILPSPYPSATGGNTYLYEEGGNGNSLNHSAAIVPIGGGGRGRGRGSRGRSRSRGKVGRSRRRDRTGKYTKGRKIPKYISNKKTNKKKCQVCNFKIF